MQAAALTDRIRISTVVVWGFGSLVALALLVHFAHTLLGFASPTHDFLIEEWVYNFVMIGAAVATLARAALRPDNRLPWALVGMGLACWAAGDLYWTLVYAKLEEPPFPGVADYPYLAGYVFALLGIAGLVRARVRTMSATVWADVAVGSLCVAAIGTTLLMDFVLANTTGTTLEIVVALAYPVLDLAALALVAATLALTGWLPGRALGFVAIGIAAMGVADAVYTYQSLAGTYSAISWNNSLWPLGSALIAVGALQPRQRSQAGQPQGWQAFVSPTIFAFAVFAFVVIEDRSATPLVASLSALTLAAVVVRIGFTIAENYRLVGALQRDPLTRLGNRSKLFLDLERTLHDEDAPPHVVAILDLDGFKSYNDAFGHPAGDSLLVRLSTHLDKALQGRGGAYRLGGDEFAVIAEGDTDAAAATIQEAADALTEQGEGFRIGSSCGTVEVPREACDAMRAIQLADRRMYDRKESRRPTLGGEVEAVLAHVVQQRAPELREHGNSVAELAVKVGRRLGITGTELTALSRAAELHDVGKVAIPDAILQKAGPLDADEWEFMRQHTILGERIIGAARSLAPLGRVVRATHERWDGKGYPDRIAAEEIPLAARIIFACDAYDAMRSERPYATAMSGDAALAELRRNAGIQFDPEVVAVILDLAEQRQLEGRLRDEIPAPSAVS